MAVSFRRLALVCAVAVLCAQLPAASAAEEPRVVEQWDFFELELRGPAEGNPFVDVRLSAVFTDGPNSIEVPGFYDGDGVYRVRFMPPAPGTWRFETRSNQSALARKSGSFEVVPPRGRNHGPVRVRNTFHFAYADGTPFKPLGTTIYNWIDAPEDVQEQTLRTLASAPFNKARMLVTQQSLAYRKEFPPARWPFAGQPPRDWDFTRFNPEFFRHYEKRLAQLRDLGIEADVILFNPYGRWGFETMDPAADERYVRYVVARFGAFRNVWWSLANEYDFLRAKTEADWDRLGALLMECDVHQHLRSIHNGTLIYDHRRAWVTHASIQNGAAVEESGRAQLYRDVYRKPIVYDEVKYEGNSRKRWGNLTGAELVHRFWCATVAGTYVTHGEAISTVEGSSWLSFGGTLRGESPPRLAFLRRVLDDAPAGGLDPIDKWQDVTVAGKPGEFYLIYLGRAAPAGWPFQLYKEGVSEGMRFAAEIIDPWNMTITPVAGEFVTKRNDDYHFIDAGHRAIALPARPGMALRLRRIDANPAQP